MKYMIKKFIARFSTNIDGPLLWLILPIIILGLIILISASQFNTQLIVNQITNITIGLVVLFLIANMNPRRVLFYSPYLYILTILLLLAVYFFGSQSHGAKRWIDIWFISFQPSEVAKITLPLFIAWIYNYYQTNITLKTHLYSFFVLVIPCILIFKQPDLGTSVMIFLSGFIIIFLSGLSLKTILASASALIISFPFFWATLHTYQQNRILNLIDPTNDSLGAGYQAIQSIIAIGSGGFFGKGWSNGTQASLDFLPEVNTDFIFAVFAEEFGFFGILILFSFYGFILFRSFTLTTRMQNTFSKLVTASLIVSLFSGFIVNIAMVSGVIPIVGVPLPFMSYGGTSMVVSMATIGIIMSLYSQKSLIAN